MFRDDPPEIVRLGHMIQREARAISINVPELAARDLLLWWRDNGRRYQRR